jgi:hypothetical protein
MERTAGCPPEESSRSARVAEGRRRLADGNGREIGNDSLNAFGWQRAVGALLKTRETDQVERFYPSIACSGSVYGQVTEESQPIYPKADSAGEKKWIR